MYNLYAQHELHGLMVRAGKPSMNIDRALERARKLRALQVEIRNESLPRRKSLVAIFRGGVQVTGVAPCTLIRNHQSLPHASTVRRSGNCSATLPARRRSTSDIKTKQEGVLRMFKLPSHMFVSECDGHMFDTRKPDWSHSPLRRDYAIVKREVDSISLRAAIRQRFSWPGGYELMAFTSDSGTLCMECCRKEYRQIAWSMRHQCGDGWWVVGIDAACNYDEIISCDHCGKIIVEGDEG